MHARVARYGIVVALAIVAAACSASGPSGDVTSGPGGPRAADLVADDGRYSPRTLRVDDKDVTVEFTNSDDQPHDFVVKSVGLDTGLIEPGEVVTARFTVRDDETSFVCSIHPDMKGTITIDEKGARS